jgi:ubiquinone/menaquinone biosynthesis C-methylase UbiE
VVEIAIYSKAMSGAERRGVVTIAPISPKDVINSMSVEALCKTADEYYGKVADPTSLLSKPFADLGEAPEMIYRLGLLVSGLQLAKGLQVLDFGSGACWLSRILNQFGCATISMDASAHALEMGRRLFALQPVLGGSIAPPDFIHFDGRHINIPDTSVDRIVCFDAFHHVPNQREVLTEFYRVLKEGGIAGFSEPGRNHSKGPQSQYEMANYRVLENDIIIEDIIQLAKKAGFAGAYLKPLFEPNTIVTQDEYAQILRKRVLPDRLVKSSLDAMASGTVFFLVRGRLQPDSRSAAGFDTESCWPPQSFT